MEIQNNVKLDNYNTFGIKAQAKELVEIHSIEDLKELRNSEHWNENHLVIGGGSNILLTGDFDGLVILNRILGVEIVYEDDSEVVIKIGSGENWHELVLEAVKNNWGGIENLSLIPGTVGAAPMQNIGAYGVEIKSVFEKLEAFEIETGKMVEFDNKSCDFDYRYSVFKGPLKGKYIICNVTLRLQKSPSEFNTSYYALSNALSENQVTPSLKTISDTVIAIRKSKLPDPVEIGNAGSFFKNPILPIDQFNTLKEAYPNIPSFPVDETTIKVPAAWLIDQSGWKGYRDGNIGVHNNQALVLVNYGDGNGEHIQRLSEAIQKSVKSKFGVELKAEVNII